MGTYAADGYHVYVDGTLRGSGANDGDLGYFGSEAAIGRDGHACDGVVPSFAGQIADVAVYPAALSAERVAAHYRASGRTIGPARYVALGDSFSSGEGVPPFDHGNDVPKPDNCHRSTQAYAKVLTADSSTAISTLGFWACSGATRTDVVRGESKNSEGPQLARIDKQTNLITISVGGNDVRFSDVLDSCATGLATVRTAFGGGNGSPDCQNMKVKDPHDGKKTVKLSDAENTLVADLGVDSGGPCAQSVCTPALHNLYLEIAARAAPGVKIRVLLYPHLFKTNPGGRGCTLRGAAGLNFSGQTVTISDRNMLWINKGVDQVDDKITSEVALARAAGLDIRTVDPRPVFDDDANGASPGGHGVCTAQMWLNGLQLGGDKVYSFHPNRMGQSAFAGVVKATLGTGN